MQSPTIADLSIMPQRIASLEKQVQQLSLLIANIAHKFEIIKSNDKETVKKPIAQPLAKPIAKPIAESVKEPIALHNALHNALPNAESVKEPIAQHNAESVKEPYAQPNAESVKEPIPEPAKAKRGRKPKDHNATKKPKDNTATKKNISGYRLFSNAFRDEVKESFKQELPDNRNEEFKPHVSIITSKLSKMWKALEQYEKDEWNSRAKQFYEDQYE